MDRRSIPPYFRRVVIDYYNYMSERASENSVIMNELPSAIQGRLQLLLNRDLVRSMPLLRQLEMHTIIALMQLLESNIFLPGEFIFRTGERGNKIYFVKTGGLNVVLGDGTTVVGKVGKGELVGQVAFMAEDSPDFSVRAAIYTEALILNRYDYDEVADESMRFVDMMEHEAKRQAHYIMHITGRAPPPPADNNDDGPNTPSGHTTFFRRATTKTEYSSQRESSDGSWSPLRNNRMSLATIGRLSMLPSHSNKVAMAALDPLN